MAIAYDSSSSGGTVASNTLTFSHTCSGSNRILWVGIEGDGSTDTLTSVAYNGVAMTRIDSISSATTANRWLYLYYLIAPATGANNVVATVSSGTVVLGVSASYTGALQSGVPDSTNKAGSSSGTSRSVSTTTVLDNCWVVGHFNGAAAPTAVAGTTLRATESTYGFSTIGDSNGDVTPAGAKSLGITWTGSNGNGGIVASFAPVTSTTYNQSIPATATASVLLSKVRTVVQSLTQTATAVLSLTKVRTVVKSLTITATAVVAIAKSWIHLISLAVGGSVSLSDGPQSPATTADDATVGTVAWTNPNNAQADDASYATVVLASVAGVSNESSHYLKATNLAFAIPTAATITGIVVEEKVVATNNVIRNANTKLVKGGAFVGTAKTTATFWPTSEAYISFGGSSDLWGTTWTPAEVNSSGFGVGVSAWNANSLTSSHTASLNHIRITVHYTTVNGVASVTLTKQLVRVVPLSLSATAAVALSKVKTAVRSLSQTATASVFLARTVMFTLRITAQGVLSFVKTTFQTFAITATGITPAIIRTIEKTLSVTSNGVASLVKGLVSVRDLAATATASISLSKTTTFFRSLSVTSLGVLNLAKGFLFTKTLAVTATALSSLSRVATHFLALAVTALAKLKLLINGLQSFFSGKYPSQSGSYSEKFPSSPGSYSEKYPSRTGNYDKYPS